MSALLGALLVLRVAAVVLAVLLVAAVVLLLVPVGLDIRWTKKGGAIWKARCGPLTVRLYPFPEEKPNAAQRPGPRKNRKKASAPDTQNADRPAPQSVGSSAGATSQTAAPGAAASQAEPTPVPQAPERGTSLPSTAEMRGLLAAGRILARTMWPHRAWLLRRMRVQHLCIYWTVTGEDAADTAVCYGCQIAALNTMLAAARDHLEIQSDSLRLEPDFTGEQREKRSFSCQVRARAYIMIGVFRILLRPDPRRGRTPLEELAAALNAGE